MTPPPARLVACDLDDTLVRRDGTLSARNATAVRAAQDAGIVVIVATGRPWQWTLDLARRHELRPTAVCSNGACLADVATGALEITGLAADAAATILDRARAVVPSITFAVDAHERLAHEPGFLDQLPDDIELLGDTMVEDLAPLLAGGVVKLIARAPGVPGGELAATLDAEVLDGVAVPHAGTGEWVELLANGVSKASGIAVVCDRLGIEVAEVVAVGDGWNDVAMLEWAGLGVAVGNASGLALDAADRVVAAAVDDGVAELLEELTSARLAA